MARVWLVSQTEDMGEHMGRRSCHSTFCLRSILKKAENLPVVVEKYETDFPVKLAACVEHAAAEARLGNGSTIESQLWSKS